MIGKLTGTLAERNPPQVVVDCNGVGYEVDVPLSVGELSQIVTLQDAGRLVKIPGIGKKTAERLLLELKGKLGADLALPAHAATDAQADILQALIALGYSDKEASAALKALPKDASVSEGIKLALRALAK
jgi:Holliday junction DNA helicase RuvA